MKFRLRNKFLILLTYQNPSEIFVSLKLRTPDPKVCHVAISVFNNLYYYL